MRWFLSSREIVEGLQFIVNAILRIDKPSFIPIRIDVLSSRDKCLCFDLDIYMPHFL